MSFPLFQHVVLLQAKLVSFALILTLSASNHSLLAEPVGFFSPGLGLHYPPSSLRVSSPTPPPLGLENTFPKLPTVRDLPSESKPLRSPEPPAFYPVQLSPQESLSEIFPGPQSPPSPPPQQPTLAPPPPPLKPPTLNSPLESPRAASSFPASRVATCPGSTALMIDRRNRPTPIGLIAGAVIGSVVIEVGLFTIFFIWRKRTSRTQPQPQQQQQPPKGQPKTIHRDIKAANILIYDNFEPKVADFALARFSFDSQVMTRILGSFGYLAPEYAASGKLTEKSDVFSFGVVLLELIIRRNVYV